MDTLDSTIEQIQLTELKINLDDLFEKFSWTKNWFALCDNILVTLGYYNKQNDIKRVKTFLHDKFKKTHVYEFNKFLAGFFFEKKYINNHYDCLEKHPNKINWSALSKNPNAIHILEKHLNKIDWRNLSANPSAIHLLKQHPSDINWECLSANTYNYFKEKLEYLPMLLPKSRLNVF